jgi:hypothetical protein
MKILVVLTIILLPLFSSAQKKRDWKISYENSVNKMELSNIGFYEDTKGYDKLPQYFNHFDAPFTYRYRVYSNDSLGYENSQSSYSPYLAVYFRNTYLGISTSIVSTEYIDFNHAAGLNLSLADYRLGTVRINTIAETLDFDSIAMERREYREVKSISAYKKVRRLALSYENTIALKPTKWLHMSIGARQQLHFKFTDDFLTGYAEYGDTTSVSSNYFLGVDNGVRYFQNVNLYDRQYPSNLAHESARNLSLQYDLTLFLRPEFILGKTRKTSIYCNIGYTPIHYYGSDFRPEQNPIWYGIGLSRVL